MEWKLVLLSVMGLLGLFLMGTVLVRPLKLLFHVGICFVTGGVLLFLANLLLGLIGLRIAVNLVTLLTAGLLQIPGVILLAILDYFFV